MMSGARKPVRQTKGAVMRRWCIAFCLIGLASSASAGEFEMPVLRGSTPFIPAPPRYTRWSGFYAGGQFGYSTAHADFTSAFDSLNVFDPSNRFTAPFGSVSSWAALGRTDQDAGSYGGFFGYNAQWEDAILSAEVNYNHSSLSTTASDSQCYSDTNLQCLRNSITLGDGNSYDATVDATATARITDYATFRGRAGWAFRNFMPYAMFGLAVGRVETTRTATATGTPIAAGSAFVATEGDARSRYSWGYTVGGGFDFLLLSNVFLRAEYEFIHLNPVADIKLDIGTARRHQVLRRVCAPRLEPSIDAAA
jgi:outer membrane immunogenic protein